MMKSWKLSDKLALWALIVTVVLGLLGLLFGQDLLSKFSASTSEPKFQYIFEGAFDQTKPEYEVAFPLGWDDSQKSNAHIRVRADYGGKKYAGITYIKVQQADKTVITVGQWDDFSTDAGKQQDVALSFSRLFELVGFEKSVANFDVSTGKPELVSGQFKIYAEYAGQVIPGSEQTVTVYNTPWFHRTYLNYSEVGIGDKISAYVEVINYGAESDFSIDNCANRIVTPSYQVDPSQVAQLDQEGWWPDRTGNLQRVCPDYQQNPIHLKSAEKTTLKIELPDNATAEQGFYDYIVYVSKKLPVLEYNDPDWASNQRSRDARQHTTYVVVGK